MRPRTNSWSHRCSAVADAIGDRRLVWFGIRGVDAGPLLALEQFRESYAVTATLAAAGLEATYSLEDETLQRVDLDRYDIDEDEREQVRSLRRKLLVSLAAPSVLMAYRSAGFVSSVHFPNLDTTTLATMFVERQRPFEHKPWVELELARAGVRTIPWRYVSDEDHLLVGRWLRNGPIVLRPSRTSGGVGLVLVEDGSTATLDWPRQRDAFVAVSPYMGGATPVNVGACAFRDGSVSVHAPSVQLIGLPACTNQRFGYCGNDFGAIADLSPSALADLDDMVRMAGRWLSSCGYVGAFGVDALVGEDEVFLTEVNPRFQGSSLLGAELARWLDVPDLFLDHLAAFLGVEPGIGPTLADWANARPDLSHVIVHNRREVPVALSGSLPRGQLPDVARAELVVPPGVEVEPGGVLFRARVAGRITDVGTALREPWEETLRTLQSSFGTGAAPGGPDESSVP